MVSAIEDPVALEERPVLTTRSRTARIQDIFHVMVIVFMRWFIVFLYLKFRTSTKVRICIFQGYSLRANSSNPRYFLKRKARLTLD